MLNPLKEINWNPDRKHLKSFARSISYGFAIFAIIFLLIAFFKDGFKSRFSLFGEVFIIISILVYLLSMLFPPALRVIYFPWFFLSACIGFVVMNVFISLFYYLAFSVFAFVFRTLSKRDPLQLRKNYTESLWINCKPIKTKKYYFKQY